MNKTKIVLIIIGFSLLLLIWAINQPKNPEIAGIIEPAQQLLKVDSDAFFNQISTDNVVILDIRTPEEYSSGHIENAVNVDYYAADFINKLEKLDKNATYMVYCRSGNRSGSTVTQMEKLGFKSVYELNGGINAWLKAGNHVCKNC